MGKRGPKGWEHRERKLLTLIKKLEAALAGCDLAEEGANDFSAEESAAATAALEEAQAVLDEAGDVAPARRRTEFVLALKLEHDNGEAGADEIAAAIDGLLDNGLLQDAITDAVPGAKSVGAELRSQEEA